MHRVRWPARPLFSVVVAVQASLARGRKSQPGRGFAQASEARHDIALQIDVPSLLPFTTPRVGSSKFVAARTTRFRTFQLCKQIMPLLRRMHVQSVEGALAFHEDSTPEVLQEVLV
ncbi:unnamed protein product [Symbiodinium sp. CCMP2592]|nr:unnamed protein product [Symbiodinium sp. CCMP2592]